MAANQRGVCSVDLILSADECTGHQAFLTNRRCTRAPMQAATLVASCLVFQIYPVGLAPPHFKTLPTNAPLQSRSYSNIVPHSMPKRSLTALATNANRLQQSCRSTCTSPTLTQSDPLGRGLTFHSTTPPCINFMKVSQQSSSCSLSKNATYGFDNLTCVSFNYLS